MFVLPRVGVLTVLSGRFDVKVWAGRSIRDRGTQTSGGGHAHKRLHYKSSGRRRRPPSQPSPCSLRASCPCETAPNRNMHHHLNAGGNAAPPAASGGDDAGGGGTHVPFQRGDDAATTHVIVAEALDECGDAAADHAVIIPSIDDMSEGCSQVASADPFPLPLIYRNGAERFAPESVPPLVAPYIESPVLTTNRPRDLAPPPSLPFSTGGSVVDDSTASESTAVLSPQSCPSPSPSSLCCHDTAAAPALFKDADCATTGPYRVRRKSDASYLTELDKLPSEYQYRFDAQLTLPVGTMRTVITKMLRSCRSHHIQEIDNTGRTTAEFLCSYPGVSWNTRMQSWLVYYEDVTGRRSKTFNPKKFTDDKIDKNDPRWKPLWNMDPMHRAMHCACAFAAAVRYRVRLYKSLGFKVVRTPKKRSHARYRRSLSGRAASSSAATTNADPSTSYREDCLQDGSHSSGGSSDRINASPNDQLAEYPHTSPTHAPVPAPCQVPSGCPLRSATDAMMHTSEDAASNLLGDTPAQHHVGVTDYFGETHCWGDAATVYAIPFMHATDGTYVGFEPSYLLQQPPPQQPPPPTGDVSHLCLHHNHHTRELSPLYCASDAPSSHVMANMAEAPRPPVQVSPFRAPRGHAKSMSHPLTPQEPIGPSSQATGLYSYVANGYSGTKMPCLSRACSEGAENVVP